MDDLAHVPLPDYINLTDTELRRTVGTSELLSQPMPRRVEANDVKCKGLLNVTLVYRV